MTQLDCRKCALAANEVGDPAVNGNMIVRIYPGTFIGLAATFLDCRFFRKDDPGAAYRVFPQIYKMPIGRCAAYRPVLAHRRNDNAIARKNPTQRNRLKKKRKPDPGVMHGRHLRNRYATWCVSFSLR